MRVVASATPRRCERIREADSKPTYCESENALYVALFQSMYIPRSSANVTDYL